MSQKVLELLQQRFGDAIVSTHSQHGDDTAVVARDRLVEVARWLRDDPATLMNFPSDMTAVDHLPREPRFEVVYHLRSIKHRHRIRLKAQVPDEDCTCPSLTPLWSGFNWFERECFDMFGIRFTGHPDLRRMFLWDSFEGHPLRKDYPKEKRQPLFRREGVE